MSIGRTKLGKGSLLAEKAPSELPCTLTDLEKCFNYQVVSHFSTKQNDFHDNEL